jgi:hypothetical protein
MVAAADNNNLIDVLLGWRRNLEEQVLARTEELEVVNAQLSLEIASRRNNELVQQEMLKELASRNATLEHFAKLTVHDLR